MAVDSTELSGFGLSFKISAVDKEDYIYPETTELSGFGLSFKITDNDRRYLTDETDIVGFGMTFKIEQTFRAIQINTRRL